MSAASPGPRGPGAPSAVSGIGIDLIETDRFKEEKDLPGLLRQILTEGELSLHPGVSEDPARCAVLFAAKEAVLKALAGGLDRGSCWHEVELTGDFRVVLSGAARRLAEERSVGRVLVCLSRAGGTVMALALAEA